MMERFTGAGGTSEGRGKVIAMQPIGRMCKPGEIAAAVVVWLCSDAPSFVIGHALAVDGGFVVP
jgi:NAD(P)-dependent dehydrogenase (short-subunit alcohol dehydrogenase family)